MRKLPLAAACGLLPLVAACAPNPPAPVDVVVLRYEPSAGVYQPQRMPLTTVTNLTRMEGPVAQIIGGARFKVNSDDPALLSARTEEDLVRAIRKNDGHGVRVNLISSEGAFVPADFHSLNIATTYYNFEKAYNFFNKIGGLKSEQFGTPPVYYFADLEEEGETQRDNAMYLSLVQGFLILPFDVLQEVPLSINIGVVGHEYAHAVFNYRVFAQQALPTIQYEWESAFGANPGANLLAALDEGAADLFGTGITCSEDLVTCDPEFIGHSLPDDFRLERRVNGLHCLTAGLQEQLTTKSYVDFTSAANTACAPYGCNYKLGSVFASAVWRAASDPAVVAAVGVAEARKQVFQAVWYAEGGGASETAASWREQAAEAATNQLKFSLDSTLAGPSGSVLDAVIEGATEQSLKVALCSAFLDRFNLTKAQIYRCPATAQSYAECPR